MKVVADFALYTLRACTDARNNEARILGEATIEFELKADELRQKFNGTELATRIGAVLFEFETYKAAAMKRIRDSRALQLDTGRAAMLAIGVNPEEPGKDYDIDLSSGIVRFRRSDGIFVPLDLSL